MKKSALLISALMLVGIFAQTQLMGQNYIDLGAAKSVQMCSNLTDDGFSATFSFNGINATEVSTEKGVFSHLTMDGTVPAGNIGDPTVPAVNKLIAIPIGANNVSVEVKNYTTSVYNLSDYGIHSLDPQQTPLRKDQKPGDLPFDYNAKAYTTPGFAERPIAMFEIEGTMRGIQVGALTLNPVQYDAVNNAIRVYNDIEVEVSFGKYDKAAAYNEFARTFTPYYVGLYKTMFNYRQLNDVYDEHPDLWQNPVKMLVITNRTFESTIQDWVNWKTEKGFFVDVNYTDEIGTTAAAIKTFIQQKYATDAPTFLMIMGDKNQVPESAIGSETQCVTDLYYMSVDGDEFADIFHSRFPAEDVSQMIPMLNKALEYEQLTMPDPSYLGNVLLIAGEDSGWGVTVGRPTIWYATNYYYNEEHGLNNVYEYSHGQYSGCYNNLSTGVGFANYTAHGSNTSWSGPSFTNSDVNNLTNIHKYFLAMGNCCQAADWGINGPCFGEAMVRAENKAAYAYIGSCPSTYWLNDYYFGVGATSVANGTMPTFEQTTMGAYDAIWDDAAYNTVCAIPFIGNLAGNAAGALGYTLHISTLYCWQAYHVLGDGSILPYRVVPTENEVSHMATVPIGVNYYTVSAAPGSYVGISKDGVLYGAGMIDETGTTDITLEPITSGGDVNIVVTHPQHVPYRATVPAAALDGAYLTYDNCEAQNEVIDGAWVPVNLTIKNVGADIANNVTVTVTTESEYVTMINNESVIDVIPADEAVTIENAFDFNVAVNVPDQQKIQFFVNCTDGTNTWESKFNLVAKAPNLSVEGIAVSELAPGEDGTITFTFTNNGGADAVNPILDFFISDPSIEVENSTINIDVIPAGESVTVEVLIHVNEDVQIGSSIEYSYLLAAGHYSIEGTSAFAIGNISDDFESGDFSAFPWTFTGNQQWGIDNAIVHNGNYSAKSGDISHSQQTDITLTVEVLADGQVSFYKKVSSENNYDKLFFLIDNIEKSNWSGDVEWSLESFPISVGTHTLTWSYRKDYSVDGGQDCAWIDDVQLPPTNVTTSLPAVNHLNAEVEGNDVILNWGEMENATSYMVRRDGELVGTVTDHTFTETVSDGIYTYCVIATDDEGHLSAPAYVTVNVGTVGVEESNTTINIYPNPVKDMLTIEVNAEFQYGIFNNMGQQVMNGTANGEQRLDVSDLAKGIYVLRITTENQNKIQKIVVE